MENHVSSTPSEADKIPKEIELVLPSNPFEILRISRALALQACAARIQSLESEKEEIKSSSDTKVKELEGKVASLQQSLKEADEKLSKAQEEQEKLGEEKAALVAMVKKLNRDVAKLEAFKRTLMSQLQDEGDDDGSGAKAMTSDASDNRANLKKTLLERSESGDASENSEAKPPRPNLNIRTSFRTPAMTPSLFSPAYTPSATPPHTSSSAASPRVGGKSARSRVDGKEFFRQARSRLSYEQFSTFLATIKELNAHKQTREDTLKKAEEIFGKENKDLYEQFQNLLSRHLPT